MTALDGPLLRMTLETSTQYWNDSCAIEELAYAVERGATGATSNPSIVLEVMRKEAGHWVPRVHELAREEPAAATWRSLWPRHARPGEDGAGAGTSSTVSGGSPAPA